jgi:hypothetical protein
MTRSWMDWGLNSTAHVGGYGLVNMLGQRAGRRHELNELVQCPVHRESGILRLLLSDGGRCQTYVVVGGVYHTRIG